MGENSSSCWEWHGWCEYLSDGASCELPEISAGGSHIPDIIINFVKSEVDWEGDHWPTHLPLNTCIEVTIKEDSAAVGVNFPHGRVSNASTDGRKQVLLGIGAISINFPHIKERGVSVRPEHLASLILVGDFPSESRKTVHPLSEM